MNINTLLLISALTLASFSVSASESAPTATKFNPKKHHPQGAQAIARAKAKAKEKTKVANVQPSKSPSTH